MPLRNRRIKKKNQSKKFLKLGINLGTLLLLLIVLGFFYSGIDRLFYNDGINIEYPDLGALITQTQYEKNTGHKIQVEIWNGCGIPKLAQMYTNFLRSEGIDVLASANADNFDYLKTIILHHRGAIERALTVADIMKIDKNSIIEDHDDNLFFDLTLILGEDYLLLPSYRDALMHQQPF